MIKQNPSKQLLVILVIKSILELLSVSFLREKFDSQEGVRLCLRSALGIED